MRHQAFSMILLAACAALVTAGPARAADSGSGAAKRTAVASNTQFLLFDAQPAAVYDVRRNGTSVTSAGATPSGVVAYSGPTASGDVIEFRLTGVVPVAPNTPTGLAASGNTQGCVALSWDAPDPGDYVTAYSVLWGTTSGAYTDSLQITRLDVASSGGRWSASRCGFPTGNFYFALRAHNAYDLWSPVSNPAAATISNENTQGPPPPTNVAVSEDPLGCAHVTWKASGDATVTGYRVYLGTAPRSQAAYTDSIDVGQTTSASFCTLSPGTYYTDVRARTSLGILSGYSKEVSVSILGPDVTPPVVSQMSPPDGATGVARNTGVFFVVTDTRSGVSFGSLSVHVDGVACPARASRVTGGYAIECQPAAELPANAAILVEVTAADRASPANVMSASWTFHTGANSINDVDPPLLQAASPTAGAVGVAPNASIDVAVSDAGLGVNFSTVTMTVNGTAVDYRLEGDPASAHIIYDPSTPYPGGSTVNVRVEACDRASPSNCAATLSFSFTTGVAAIANIQGAIVPDGFWADDPSRPLEVRNLPRSWHVRIFDEAGTPVRRFENDASDGFTWTWNFMNDWGQRVAPALYLVRVTDGDGAVRESGRFLVQSPR